MDEHSRTAFTAALVLDRRQQAVDASAISAVAVDSAGQRLYVGLEDGVLEEHAILRGPAGLQSSLAARKHAAKKAILSIHALPEHGLVVLLSEDGLVHLLDAESLEEGRPLPLRHALATCVATPPGCLPRLAVAVKPSKRTIRFMVFELPPSSSGAAAAAGHPHPAQLLAHTEVPDSATSVHGMGWVGSQLAVCCGMRYLLVAPFGPARPSTAAGGAAAAAAAGGQWQELFSVPGELAYWPAMLTTVPDLGQALLVVGPAGIVVDAGGNPVGSALRLEGLGATPRALAASGAFALVVSEAAIHVFDRQSGGEVQRLAFAPELRPLPAQPLYAVAAGDGMAGTAGPGGPAGTARAGSGGAGACVAVAGRRIVWLCLPVCPADQARELLGQRDYEAALGLVEAGLAEGAAWAQVAAAQAALLLLQECRFEEAVRCLEQCSPATFQPSQLFQLFPTYTAPWAGQVPTHQSYWGLHAPLPSLEALISSKLNSGQRQQESSSGGGGGGSGDRGEWHSPPASSLRGGRGGGSSCSSSLFGMDREGGSSGGGASPVGQGSRWNEQGDGASKGQPPGNQQEGAAPPAAAAAALEEAVEARPGASQVGTAQRPASSEGAEQQQRRRRLQGQPARRQLQRRAWESIAQYLFRVRMLEGVSCLPGVDTLLLLLLADLGDARQVAAFAAVPNQVDVRSVEPRLQAEQWHHALATLHAARGDADVALHIWRQVADGQLAAPAGPSVQAAERREALECAASLLRDPAACPEASLVGHIPWLLAASQPAALDVLTARSLTPASVLPLLPAESDVRWQYLAHLVEAEDGVAGGAAGSSQAAAAAAAAAADPALHTELAVQLAAAILRAEPRLRTRETAVPARPSASRRASAGGSAAARSGSAGGRRRLPSRTSTAALVSGGSLEPWPGASPADVMRLRLRAHLERSARYDAAAVLRSLQGTALYEELIVLHSKAGDHMPAMRLLALTLHDVVAAEAYARAHLAPADYRALLHLVLEPGPGLEPRWEDACYLIAVLGDHLDPQEVLQALPPSMPLASAAGVVGPMLRDRLHRRRQGALTKNLHRARFAAAAGALCDAQARHTTVGEDRACPHCHLRLGGKVFVVLQQPVLGASGGGGANGLAAGAGGAVAAAGGGDGAAVGCSIAQQQQQQPPQQQQLLAGRRGEEAGEEGLRPPGEDSLAATARRLQQQVAAGQEPQVLCYACYRRLLAPSSAAAAGPGAGVGQGAAGEAALL